MHPLLAGDGAQEDGSQDAAEARQAKEEADLIFTVETFVECSLAFVKLLIEWTGSICRRVGPYSLGHATSGIDALGYRRSGPDAFGRLLSKLFAARRLLVAPFAAAPSPPLVCGINAKQELRQEQEQGSARLIL